MLNYFFKKYKNIPIGVRASFWFAFCSFVQKGISFLATPIYTRLLSQEEFGYYSVFQSWLTILTIFATLNLSVGVFNNALLNKSKFGLKDKEVLSNFQFLEIALICITSCVIFLIRNFIGLETKFVSVLCLNIFFSSSISLWTAREKFRYKYLPVVFVSLAVSIFTVLLNILIIKYGTDKKYAIILGTTLIASLFGVVLMAYNLIGGRSFFKIKLWGYALSFNAILIPHYLSLVILASSDKIMIERMISTTASALYSVPYSISSLCSVFILAINSSLVPMTYSSLKRQDTMGLSKYYNLVLGFLIGIGLFVSLLGPEIVLIMGGDSYFEARYVVPPVAASVVFMFLYNAYGNVEFFFEKRLFTAIASTSAALLNIVLNFWLIPLFGYIAAAFTTLVCYIVFSFSHFVAYRFICKKKGINYVYNDKMIWIMCAISICFVFLTYALYINNIVRYIFIGLFVMFIIIFSKSILKYTKRIFSFLPNDEQNENNAN